MKKAILFTLVLAGCAVGPNYEKPATPQPLKYKEAGEWLVANPADTAPKGEWWKVFRDPVLDELMGRVQVNNQNLRAAEARYRQAHAQVAAARAGLFPAVGVNAGATRSKAQGDVNATATRYTVALEAQWEIDLWGKVRRQIEAAGAGAEAGWEVACEKAGRATAQRRSAAAMSRSRSPAASQAWIQKLERPTHTGPARTCSTRRRSGLGCASWRSTPLSTSTSRKTLRW